jgi:ABC-type lipoprotein export system ATPase subunit
MKILGELHAEGHTMVLVTHDMAVAEHAQRIIEIRDGRIVDDRATGKALPRMGQRARRSAAVAAAGRRCVTALRKPSAWPCAR